MSHVLKQTDDENQPIFQLLFLRFLFWFLPLDFHEALFFCRMVATYWARPLTVSCALLVTLIFLLLFIGFWHGAHQRLWPWLALPFTIRPHPSHCVIPLLKYQAKFFGYYVNIRIHVIMIFLLKGLNQANYRELFSNSLLVLEFHQSIIFNSYFMTLISSKSLKWIMCFIYC